MATRKTLGTPASNPEMVPKSYVDALVAALAYGVGPVGHGALAWTNDPAVGQANVAQTTGRFTIMRFRAAASGSIATAWFGISTTAGASVTHATCAIFDLAGGAGSTGGRLGVSNTETTLLQSTGTKQFTFASPVPIVLGTEYVACVLINASTMPTLNCTIAGSRPSLGITAGTGQPLRQALGTATGQTSIPTTLTWTAFADVANGPHLVFRP